MITEDFVSFETAKLLKEKGFDWDCKQVYDLVRPQSCADGKMYDNFPDKNPNAYDELVSAPTLQMAMKWLRKNFGLHCQIDCPIAASNWVYGIRDLNEDEWVTLRNMGDYETYEEACEDAIKYCLKNLI